MLHLYAFITLFYVTVHEYSGLCGIMKIFISVHWQAQTLNYEVVPSLLMTLCAERVVSCVATRCLRHNNGHDAVPFNSVLWALLCDFWLFQSSDGLDISPLMSRPKKDSEMRRIVLDLSWSQGFSVNDGIDSEYYLDYESKVKLFSMC